MRACCTAIMLTIAAANVAAAQMAVEVNGTVVSMDGGVIFVKENGTDRIFRCDTARNFLSPVDNKIYVTPDVVKISVTGTEEVGNLRTGMNLQFTVTLANKRVAQGEVDSATIFTASALSPMGILSSEPVEAAEDADKKAKPATLEKCVVAGTITRIKNNQLTISVPSEKRAPTNLNIRLAEDAAITLSSDNLNLVRAGDMIKASGTGWVPQHFLAREIKIEHTPLLDEKYTRNRGVANVKPKPGEMKQDRGAPVPEVPIPVAKAKVKLQVMKVN